MAKAAAIFTMATKIDIANQALSLLGDPATVTSIDPPDGSDQAGNVSRWYPIALRRVIEEHEWSFLTKSVRPARLGGGYDGLTGYKHAYRMPSDSVRVIGVYAAGSDRQEAEFGVQVYPENDSLMILTDEADPVLRYVAHIDKPAIFPGYFVECVVIALATYLNGPLKDSSFSAQVGGNLQKAYAAALHRAIETDLQVGRKINARDRIPSHLAARSV